MTATIANGVTDQSRVDSALSVKGLPLGPQGIGVSSEKAVLANEIVQKWERTREVMADARREYAVHLAFYLGQHYIWYSDVRGSVMPYTVSEPGVGGRPKARLAFNRFGLNIGNVWNRMMRSELRFEVPPTDSADNLIQGAQRSEKVAEATRVEAGIEQVRADEILGAMLGGTSAVSLEWDQTAGKQLKWNNGQDDVEFGTGDLRFTAHNVNEFGFEPNARRKADITYWLSGLAVPVGAAQAQYGLSWLPRADADVAQGTLNQYLLEQTGRWRGDNCCLVLCYYERPNRNNRQGRYTVVINNTVVHDESWPFPFDELNLAIFRQRQIDGRVLGRTYVSDGVAPQVTYNLVNSNLAEHAKLVGTTKLLATFGSIDSEDIHGQTGDVLTWTPDGGDSRPGWLEPPNLPRWFQTEPERLRAEIDALMLVSDVSKGIGYDRAAAQALTFLAEQDDSSFGHMVFEQKREWESLMSKALELYGSKVQDTRTARLPAGPQLTEAVEWNGRMLQGQYRVNVPIDSVTPRNAAAKLANAKDLWDRKIITDARQYARMSGLPADEFEQLLDPDAAAANAENLRMMMGYAEVPSDFEDHKVHIAEHNDRLRKTNAYKYAEPEVRKIVDDHINYHQAKAAAEFARQTAAEQAMPMASTVPQADAPEGSDVPMGEQEQQARMASMAAMGGNPSGLGMGGGASGQTAGEMAAPPQTAVPGGGTGGGAGGAM